MHRPLSQMLAIPASPDSLHDPEELLRRVQNTGAFQLHSSRLEDETLHLEISSDGELYHAEIYPTEFMIPELYRCQHLFPDVDVEAIERAQLGLAAEMEFGPDALASYHLQLKLICTLVPDLLAVLDDSSEKILSGRWVTLAAQSRVAPAPRYLYTAQAVSGGDDCVWLHTHGLNRCGCPELEVLNSTKETYQSHYNVLETLANRLLDEEEIPGCGEPFFLAYVDQEIPLIVTLIPWADAVENYPEDMTGGKADRQEGHNEDTCAIFVYPSEESIDKGQSSSLAIYDQLLQDNPIYMITTDETNRMHDLASERLPYFKAAFQDSRNKLLGKFGLLIDEKYRTEDNCREHIWFEILDIQGDRFKARLTQEPYYVSGVHEGYESEFGPEDLTDWLIFTPERRISPDDVYLMEL